MSDQIQLRTVCATCQTVTKEGPTTADGCVSHGICRTCALYTLNQMEITLYERGLYDSKKNEGQANQKSR